MSADFSEHTQLYKEELSAWNDKLELSEEMIPVVGRMYRKRNVELHVYGRSLLNKSVIEVLKIHRAARHSCKERDNGVQVDETMPIAVALQDVPHLNASRIDIGKLAVLWAAYSCADNPSSPRLCLEDWLASQCCADVSVCEDSGSVVVSPRADLHKPTDVVLFGFGRIGRLVARVLLEKAGSADNLMLRAVVVRPRTSDLAADLKKRASLLRRDSTHGSFRGTIRTEEATNTIIANGVRIQLIYARDRTDVDYTAYGISDAILIDNTGLWRSEEDLGVHLQCPGIERVVLTAPGTDIPNIVMGVNEALLQGNEKVVAAASCTTNAVCPPLKLIHDTYGIQSAHIETIHSYTNDQNLLDNYHKKPRRGRAAPLNMVLTSTGAAKAVAQAIPELGGLLTGNAVRCPTPDVSMAIMVLNLAQDVDREALNEVFRLASTSGVMQEQIDYSLSKEMVSSDCVGSRAACIVDAEATIVHGNRANVYCWYDNEFGYSCQVVRLVELLAKVEHPIIPDHE